MGVETDMEEEEEEEGGHISAEGDSRPPNPFIPG